MEGSIGVMVKVRPVHRIFIQLDFRRLTQFTQNFILCFHDDIFYNICVVSLNVTSSCKDINHRTKMSARIVFPVTPLLGPWTFDPAQYNVNYLLYILYFQFLSDREINYKDEMHANIINNIHL